jgi:tetratricopeptide (TPR) repeat protein
LAAAALRLARQGGFFSLATYAGLTLSTALAASGTSRAVPVARAALELALNSNSPNLLAHARLRVASVFNEVGAAREGGELAQQVIATEHLSRRFSLQARITLAQSLLQFGEIETARAAALECYRSGDDCDRGLVRGFALRTLAECANALGRRDEAVDLFSRALETLEAGNHARVLSFAERAATPVLSA